MLPLQKTTCIYEVDWQFTLIINQGLLCVISRAQLALIVELQKVNVSITVNILMALLWLRSVEAHTTKYKRDIEIKFEYVINTLYTVHYNTQMCLLSRGNTAHMIRQRRSANIAEICLGRDQI